MSMKGGLRIRGWMVIRPDRLSATFSCVCLTCMALQWYAIEDLNIKNTIGVVCAKYLGFLANTVFRRGLEI